MATSRHPLGARPNLDERNRAYPATALKAVGVPRSRTWRRYLPALNQRVGSCTANSVIGLLRTRPNVKRGEKYTEDNAEGLYHATTVTDPYPGAWPPEDTGSDLVSACNAAKGLGLISSFHWAFGTKAVTTTLATVGPVAIGTPWTTGMYDPDSQGVVHPTGDVDGYHAFELAAVDFHRKRVGAWNSWGPAWGKGGRFFIRFDDLDALLADDGMAVVIQR